MGNSITTTADRRIEIDGIAFHVRVEGAGNTAPWLTFSNSHATDLHLWDKQVAPLCHNFRILRYDTRGHGATTASDGAYDMRRLAADVIALWDALDIRESHFVGLSLGGTTGLELAATHSGRVLSLASCDCRHTATPDFVAAWGPRIALARTRGMGALVEPTIERWFTPSFRDRNPPELEKIRTMIRQTSVAGYIGCAEALKGIDTKKRLGNIRCPVLVLGGAFDPPAPPALMADIARSITNARHEIIADAAHMANIEQPEAFNRALGAFLAEVA
ncbi:MAG: 3-oxoadipate enol-lactonase [Alphaproteobacteria bacterium]